MRSKTPSRLCFLTASPPIADNRSLSSVQDELTEEEYEKQLKDVCMVLKAFEVSAEDVTALVDAEKKKPGTGAGGDNRGFDCVRIKLDVSAEGF